VKKGFRGLNLLKHIIIIRILQLFKAYKETWIHYIGGSEALPPPLENEEELREAPDGDLFKFGKDPHQGDLADRF